MSIPPYTHLHLHIEYSLLDGANKISALVKRAKELGMTDHGNMFGRMIKIISFEWLSISLIILIFSSMTQSAFYSWR